MMGALPSFAQMQPQTGGLATASLTGSNSSMSADLLGFDSVLAQNSASISMGSDNGAEPATGHFQDVNVILQLLRTASSAGQPPLQSTESAPDPTLGLGPAQADAGQKSPHWPLNPAQIGNATTQDLLDMAALLAEQTGKDGVQQDAPTKTLMDQILPATGDAAWTPETLIALTAETQGQSPQNPSPADPNLAPAPSDQTARQQSEALNILLALTQASPAAANAQPMTAAPIAAPILASLSAGTTRASGAATSIGSAAAVQPWDVAVQDTAAQIADDAMASLGSAARKAMAPNSAQMLAASNKNQAASDAALAVSGANPRATPPPASPSMPLMTASTPAGPAPMGDLGAAMSVMISSAAPAQASSAAEAAQTAQGVSEHWLDMHSDDAWIDQLAKDIAATKAATGDISFRLIPRHLGRLDVSMMQSEQGVSVHMDTQHEQTAALVTAAQGRLVDELRQQGVRVVGADVTHTPQDMTRQNSNGQGRSSQNELHHLIETASERLPDTDSDDKGTADRHGRFA